MDLRTFNFKLLYSEAKVVARDWKPDAYLHRASLPFGEEGQDLDLLAIFSFYSEEDRRHWLSVTIRSTESGALTLENEEKEFEIERPPPNPLLEESRLINSDEALAIIQEHGGAEFVAEYGRSTPTRLVLEYEQPFEEIGPLLWTGIFTSADESRSIHIKIDAYTGEVIGGNDTRAR